MAARQPRMRRDWRIDEIAALRGMDPAKAKKKLDTINQGGEIGQECPYFPEHRECNDFCWIVFFVIMILAICGTAISMEGNLKGGLQSTKVAPILPTAAPDAYPHFGQPAAAPMPVGVYAQPTPVPADPTVAHLFDAKNVKPHYVLLATVAGSAIAFVATVALVFLSANFATCVVYTSLLFSCALMIVMGISLIGTAAHLSAKGSEFAIIFYIIGGAMIGMATCMATCIMCCWRHFIAFTAEVVELCGNITLDNMGMFLVAMVGGALSAAWSVAVAFALDGALANNEEAVRSSKYGGYAFFAVFFFAWIWGCMVSASVCYTTFCGVFGRWYYSEEDPRNYEAPLCGSFIAASTTSLGSICFGTCLVAVVRTAEFVARQMQQDAANNDNLVLCIIVCMVRCVLDCIGDILEYFNEWAYVQCALRNTSFCDSAKIVYSLCTAANVWAIWATLLIDSVVSFGAFMAGIFGAAVGAGIGYMGSGETAMLGGLCGFVAGTSVGGCCMSIFTAGAKTMCTCWAEHPETLLNKSTDETSIGHTFQQKGQTLIN